MKGQPKLAKKTSKNQITLPASIARKFAGVEYFDVRTEGELIVLEPVRAVRTSEVATAAAIVRERLAALNITEQDIADAVRWARQDNAALEQS